MKALVTGGAGFIGSNLVDQLIIDGYDVLVIDNLSTGKKENVNPDAKFVECDINSRAFNIQFAKFQPDYVFHLAARPRVSFAHEHPIEAHNANVNATLNVLEACRTAVHKVRKVVYSSSSSVYGRYDLPADELHTPPKPVNMYGWQKFAGETYCKMYHDLYKLPVIALRYFNVYGIRMTSDAYGTVIGKFLDQKKKGEPLTVEGSGFQSRDFTWVGDVVNANILAATANIPFAILNIGYGQDVQIINVARAISSVIKRIPPRKNDVQFTQANNKWAKEAIGWSPTVSFRQGIEFLLTASGITPKRVYAKRRGRQK